MNLIKTCFVAGLLACSLAVSAQGKINLVKAGGNLLFLLDEGQEEDVQTLGGASLAFEHQLNNHFSLVIGANYNGREESVSFSGFTLTTRQTVFTVDPEFRWYPKAATEGFYLGIAPELYLFKYKFSGTAFTGTDDETRLGASLKTGYQFALTPALKLQVGTGFGLVLESEDTGATAIAHLNVLIGYQF